MFDEKYKIYFESGPIKEAFDKLLRYECLVCSKEKSTTTTGVKTSREKPTKEDNQRSGLKNEITKDRQTKSSRRDDLVQKNDSGRDTPSPKCSVERAKIPKAEASASAEVLEDETQGLIKSSDIQTSVFKDVFGLKNHLNYMHKLKLCDLCLTHNKLFPFEYSYYDSFALKKHMRDGEPNTSHRGHPSCPLCRQIFFNKDELLQHMSREHYHCHLCGRVPTHSNMLIYFLDYEDLRQHFKIKHYLCERGNCKYEQFTSAFDTKIDYQLHVVQVHGNPSSNLSRGEARQQRTIVLESASHRARDVSPSRALSQHMQPNSAIVSTGPMATANSARQPRPESLRAEIIQQRLPSRAEFPALGQDAANVTRHAIATAPAPVSYANQYPSLAPTSSAQTTANSVSQSSTAGPSTMRDSFVRTAGGGMRQPEQFGAMDFPPLPEQPKGKKVKKKTVANRANGRNNDSFMSLDQLISSSLTISNNAARAGDKRSGSKTGTMKSQKSAKSRPLKIQLS